MNKTNVEAESGYAFYPDHFTIWWGSIPVPAILLNDRGRLIDLNDAAVALFELSPEELRGQFWAGLDAQLTVFAWKKQWAQLQKERSIAYHTDLMTSTELLRPVAVEMTALEDTAALVVLSDRLPEEGRQRRRDLSSRVADLGYWWYNRITRRWGYSQKARELLHWSSSEESPPLADVLKSKTSAQSIANLSEALSSLAEGEASLDLSLTIDSGAGTRQLRFVGEPIGNEAQITYLTGIIQPQSTLPGGKGRKGSGDVTDELARFSIDQSRDLVFWTRPDGSFLYFNEAVTKTLGFSPEYLTEKGSIGIAPYFDTAAREVFWKRLRKEKSFTEEFSLSTRDGGEVYTSVNVNYLRVGEEEIACSFCRDLTKQREREKRRRLSEFTIDRSNEMILWLKGNGRIEYANDTFLARSGYGEEDVNHQKLSFFFPELGKEELQEILEGNESGQPLRVETPLRQREGDAIPVSAKVVVQEFENETYRCLYLRDLRKKRKRDLLIELSQTALDSADDCILWLRSDFRVQYLNQSWLSLIGGELTDYIDQSYETVLPDIDKEMVKPGKMIEVELRDIRGKAHHLELKVNQLRHGKKKYIVLAGRDVSERLKRQRELEEAYAEIRELKDRLSEENVLLREEVQTNYNINSIITISPKYQKVLRQIAQVADVDTTVLILGETGTGKELLARAVHQLSEREDASLIKVNCAALPENLIESELFGHEKGAFTGATARKKGRFEMAHRGTIFLDEIGELPLDLQSKLLRVLQEGEFERLGGTETIKVDVRLIAATNRNLEDMVQRGTFRQDLYYRLNVFPIYNLPLRDRPEDIPVLVQHFAKKFAKQQGKTIKEIDSTDLGKLKQYHFPGNIRELENIVERAVVLCGGEVLKLPIEGKVGGAKPPSSGDQPFLSFEEMQREYIVEALKRTGGRITGPSGAGRLLDLNDRTLMSKMRKLDIQKREYIV